MSNPSRKRDGFSDYAQATASRCRPKACSRPKVGFSLGRIEFYERRFAAQPRELHNVKDPKSRTGLSVKEHFQLQMTEPAVSEDFTSTQERPHFRYRVSPAVPVRVS